MSARGGSSLQPLRATVPFQLQRGPALLCRELNTDRTAARPPMPTIRRTLSLDAIVGPYLQGQWPKEAEGTTVTCANDKATQTPSSWADETRGRRSGGRHKRSASWGSAEQLRELQTVPLLPLNRLAPRLRRSVEGLNLELEEVFVSEETDDQHKILDIPDGRRAPVPVQRCSSGSQSEPSPGPLEPSLLSPSQSPQDESLLQPSCPDPNKVNFTPHGGSAFCPVSLLKPLLPSMDLLFRSLSVSPVTGCPGQASPTRHLGMQ
uniref:Uncharacterized protein n=1 Tax=Mola mola TaxID=94237 RepID=A0A3Q4BNK7_MOLML